MSLNQKFRNQLTLADGEDGGNQFEFPEDFLSFIISFTSPRDACIIACVSKSFLSAARSDVVWEKFLPLDCLSLLPPSLSWSSKKELYFALCENHVLIEDGRKSFGLEKRSGKKCYMLAAKDLGIAWGDTPDYWRWISHPESRFPETAELFDVCWLEIRGKMNTQLLSPETKYSAFVVFKLTDNTVGFEHCHVEVGIEICGKESQKNKVWLDTKHDRKSGRSIRPRHLGMPNRWRARSWGVLHGPDMKIEGPCPKVRRDGWMEIKLGEFFNDGIEDDEVEMSVMEINAKHWKTGLILQGFEVRPNDSN